MNIKQRKRLKKKITFKYNLTKMNVHIKYSCNIHYTITQAMQADTIMQNSHRRIILPPKERTKSLK